jgi:hypothetical protein
MAFSHTIGGTTFTEASFEGNAYADESTGFPKALEKMVEHVANAYRGTSTTSNAVGTGSKTWTVTNANSQIPAFAIGMPVRVSRTSAPTTTYLQGEITAFNASTGVTTVNVSSILGTGTHTDWTITIGGHQTTAAASPLAVSDGGTGAATLTDGGLLLGSGGSSAVTAMAVLTDGQMIVGDGTTDPVAESGATLRTSIGVGTGDSPQFTGLDVLSTGTTNSRISGTGNTYGQLDFYSNDGSNVNARIQSDLFQGNLGGALSLWTSPVGTGTLASRLVIDGNGNVGIGNTPAGYVFTASETMLQVGAGDDHAVVSVLSGNDKWGGLEFADDQTDNDASGLIGYYHPSNYMTFNTDGTERMRIDSSGNVLVGKTVSGQILTKGVQLSSAGAVSSTNDVAAASSYFVNLATSGTRYLQRFYASTTLVGSITSDGSATAFNTSSDYRLKENVVPMTGSIDRVNQLKPSRFNFITDADKIVDGFLAHEAQEVVPEAITGEKDDMKTEEYEITPALGDVYIPATEAVAEEVLESGIERPEELPENAQWRETTAAVTGEREVPDMQGIDQGKLVPLLVGAIQELTARLEALEK